MIDDELDAARYRWLRDNTFVEGYWLDGAGGGDTRVRVQGTGHFLDEDIDKELPPEAKPDEPCPACGFWMCACSDEEQEAARREQSPKDSSRG